MHPVPLLLADDVCIYIRTRSRSFELETSTLIPLHVYSSVPMIRQKLFIVVLFAACITLAHAVEPWKANNGCASKLYKEVWKRKERPKNVNAVGCFQGQYLSVVKEDHNSGLTRTDMETCTDDKGRKTDP